jgi:hypothetical protein
MSSWLVRRQLEKLSQSQQDGSPAVVEQVRPARAQRRAPTQL